MCSLTLVEEHPESHADWFQDPRNAKDEEELAIEDHLILKFFCGLVLVSDDAVPLRVKYPANNNGEEVGVEEDNAKDGEMEEKENSCQRFSGTDEASLLLSHSWVEKVIPGSLRRETSVAREKSVERGEDGGEEKWESKSNRGRNPHAGVVRVDGRGVVPGEGPVQVESESKNPKDCRGES